MVTERAPEDCRCYVRDLPDVMRFGLRYGAHAPKCPMYRPSRDPLDRLEDTYYRIKTDTRMATPEDWLCGYCGAGFDEKDEFADHLYEAHGETDDEDYDDPTVEP